MQSSGIHRFIVACRCNVFSCVCCSSSGGALGTISTIINLLWASINKIMASLLGLVLAIVSFIPIPRLRQWCPPQIAIFDALIAVTVGIVLYVLILWAIVSYLGSDEENNGSPELEDEKMAKEPKSQRADKDNKKRVLLNEEKDETKKARDDLDDTSGFSLGTESEQTRDSVAYEQYKERLQRMTIVKRDSVDISPSDFQPETQTAETQVRPKSRAESRSIGLQLFTMHILEISPDEAVIVESEYTGSIASNYALCDHCGADYCDNTNCPCCGKTKEFVNRQSANMNEGEEADKEEDRPNAESGNNDELSLDEMERSVDLDRWVSQVDPHFDDDESTIEQDGNFGNVNNNNQWESRRLSRADGNSSSSSGTLKGSRWRASSSDSSEYKTAEEENHNNAKENDQRARMDVLAEGDGIALGTRSWRQGGRPEALVQRISGRDVLSKVDEANVRVGRRLRKVRGRSTSTVSGDESKMSTTDTTMMSSLLSDIPSEMPSTTDGVVLISPPPTTLNAQSSDAELTLTQQLRAAKTRRVILEGGGDCDVNQLNNRLSFMDTYQQHLFQKTAVKVFGTANIDTFYEQT